MYFYMYIYMYIIIVIIILHLERLLEIATGFQLRDCQAPKASQAAKVKPKMDLRPDGGPR